MQSSYLNITVLNNMKNILSKIGKFLYTFLCRVLFVVLSALLWPVYIATTVVFVPIEFFILLFILPILWVFVGTDIMNEVGYFLYRRQNKQLWHTDYSTEYDKNGRFISFVPIWAFYVQENWLCKLIPGDINE